MTGPDLPADFAQPQLSFLENLYFLLTLYPHLDNYQDINQEENNMSMNSQYTPQIRDVTGSFDDTIKETQKLFDRGPRWPMNMPGWNPKGISAQQFRDQRWLERERARVAARTAAQLRTKSRNKNG